MAVIDKGRKERRALTRQKDKVLTPLTPSPERYAMALKDAGFPIVLKPYRMFGDVKADITDLTDITGPKGTDRWVGIAPFAAHVGKIYPLGLMEQVIAGLQGVRIFLFGSGSTERAWCEQMEASHGNVTSLIGKSNLAKALLTHGKPMFKPDFTHEMSAAPYVALRISRMGKSIPARFAFRYYDAVGVAIDFTAEDVLRRLSQEGGPWDAAKSFDGSICIGDWLDLDKMSDSLLSDISVFMLVDGR